MTDIDKERLKSFLNHFACDAPSELQESYDELINQLYVYAYGRNFWRLPFPKILEDGSFYAGPHLLTEDEEERASSYLRYRDGGYTHEKALEQAAKELKVSEKSIEAAQTKFRKRQAHINTLRSTDPSK